MSCYNGNTSTMSNYDPFPELADKKNCYGSNVENYKLTNSVYDSPSNYIGLKQYVENYKNPQINPINYATLKTTWKTQTPFDL